MRKQQLILVFAIIGYCFTQSITDVCTEKFEALQKEKCEAIHSTCSFTDHDPDRCISIINNDCSIANGNAQLCLKTVHKDFPRKKCEYDSINDECIAKDTVCTDYNNYNNPGTINGVNLNKEDCNKLKAPNTNQHCALSNDVNPTCQSYYNQCSDIFISTDITTINNCRNNILVDFNKKCEAVSGTCTQVERKCDYDIYNINKVNCNSLHPTNTAKQKCVYFDNKCSEKFISCSDIDLNVCSREKPLNGNDYDEKFKCNIFGTGSNQRCDQEDVECKQFSGPDASICPSLKVENQNKFKRCIQDTDSSTPKCKEEYNTCDDYNNNEIEKNRVSCESVIPSNSNEKCVYIPEKDICETRFNYQDCKSYNGTDKKICESIISTNTNTYCVLEKDSECIERPLLCHEAFNEDDCLYVAKASDNNKKCAFANNVCYEEYIKCEDFIEINTSRTCDSIELYDGKKCEEESGRCLTKDKEKCSEAKTKAECELIAQTGVSDPDKKICQYDEVNHLCQENYKYCSDYRGNDPTICANIKPYDESGNDIDITSKCTLRERDVGCQRVPKECRDAGENPILCALISPKIQDNKLKYCAYLPINNPSDGGPYYKCEEHFKACDKYQRAISDYQTNEVLCRNIIPQNYLKNICDWQNDKCVQIKDCTAFSISSIASPEILCRQINYNCEYESGTKTCITEEKKCKDIKFYAIHDENRNEDICKSIEASKIYKSCVLKEDLSGCEEKYNNSIVENINNNTNTNTETEGNSSGFITRGIEIMIVMLFLLI